MYDVALVALESLKRYASHLSELLCRIVGSEWRPVVVGSEIYVFRRMLSERRIYVNGMHSRCEFRVDVVYDRALW